MQIFHCSSTNQEKKKTFYIKKQFFWLLFPPNFFCGVNAPINLNVLGPIFKSLRFRHRDENVANISSSTLAFSYRFHQSTLKRLKTMKTMKTTGPAVARVHVGARIWTESEDV